MNNRQLLFDIFVRIDCIITIDVIVANIFKRTRSTGFRIVGAVSQFSEEALRESHPAIDETTLE